MSDAAIPSEFGPHPFELLSRLMLKNHGQGCPLLNSRIVFLGKDANWPPEMNQAEFRCFVQEIICPYFEDPISWLRNYDCHHPFLVAIKDPQWSNLCKRLRKNGLQYHKRVDYMLRQIPP